MLSYRRYALVLAAEIGIAAEKISDKGRLLDVLTKLEALREELTS